MRSMPFKKLEGEEIITAAQRRHFLLPNSVQSDLLRDLATYFPNFDTEKLCDNISVLKSVRVAHVSALTSIICMGGLFRGNSRKD